MSRREIEGLEDKIIQATIEIAGRNPRGSFSTKEIADRIFISEFTVFSRFKSKERLIDACNDYVFEQFTAAFAMGAGKHPKDAEGFFNEMLDWLLGHASYALFAGNYCLAFPRAGSLEKYEAFFKNLEQSFAAVKEVLSFPDRDSYISAVTFGLQEVLQDALFILSKEIPDTPANRKTMFALFDKGAQDYLTVL
jgi:AcrR family transcriptional regulator